MKNFTLVPSPNDNTNYSLWKATKKIEKANHLSICYKKVEQRVPMKEPSFLLNIYEIHLTSITPSEISLIVAKINHAQNIIGTTVKEV